MNNKMTLQNLMLNNIIFPFLVFTIFFKPSFITDSYILNEISNLLAVLLSIFFSLIYIRKNRIDKFTVSLILFILSLFISTIANSQSIIYFAKIYFPLFGLIIYINLLINYDKNKFVKYLGNYLYIIIFINFLSILFGHTGEYERMYFLGYDNSFTPVIVLGSIILSYFSFFKYDKITWKYWGINVVTIASCFLVRSSNAMMMGFFLIIFDIFLWFKMYSSPKINKIFNLKTYFWISIVVFLVLVVYRLQDAFSYIIIDILHRDLTFTGRTYIWDRAIYYISTSPIIGCGVEDFDLRVLTKNIFHAHCNYLNILLEGGVLSLTLYFNIFRVIWKKIKKQRYKRDIAVLSFGVFLFFLMSTIEYYKRNYIFYILLLTLYYCYEEKKEETTE